MSDIASIPPPRPLPIVHGRQAREEGGRLIEDVDLEFSNGQRRRYRRACARGPGSVMIAAMPDPHTILLVREFACGTHRYEIGLPKGHMDAGETPEEAANRELKEEAGFGARRLTRLRSLALSPAYMEFSSHLVLAEDLYPERLPGDEPEEIEVLPWKLADLHALMLREDCSEGRSLAALFIVRELLARRAQGDAIA
ncbi:MAG: ADP compounds hydrolase NudE [Proteobacteria bacterium]|nr:ADP compounds hydrolase NudE [Pseudomonadota bacterium]